MLTALYLTLSMLFMLFVWQTLKLTRDRYALLLMLVFAGLFYDTLVIAIGRYVGEGGTLELLNAGRYLVHALLTPTLIIFGFGVLRKAGVGWAQGRSMHMVVCSAATLLIALGAYSDILRLDLHSQTVADTLRYVNEGGMKGPPIPPILTILFLIAAGVSLWRKTGWKWLAAGAFVMFAAAAAGMGDLFYVGNLGEAVIGFANLFTARRFLSQA